MTEAENKWSYWWVRNQQRVNYGSKKEECLNKGVVQSTEIDLEAY